MLHITKTQAHLGKILEEGLSLGESNILLKNLLYLQDNCKMIRMMSETNIRSMIAEQKIGARNDTIIALYGQVSPYTEHRYWWLDSIQWQTIALCDKSGLRRKSTIPPKTEGKKKRPTNDELRNILGRFGLGTSESNEEKADRIRKELNKDGG